MDKRILLAARLSDLARVDRKIDEALERRRRVDAEIADLQESRRDIMAALDSGDA